MFTVVIPTMWKFKPFTHFLKSLLNYDLVGEVILINNNKEETPPEFFNIKSEKLKVQTPEKNIGCNPAWNLGAKLANFDHICFPNDDIIFDLALFDKVQPLLEQRETGSIGLHPGRPEYNQIPVTDGNIDLIPWDGQHVFGFGCLMFINKRNFYKIPEELFLFFGDNHLFDIGIINNKTNYIITNMTYYTPYAATTSTMDTTELIQREGKIYREELNRLKNVLKVFEIEYKNVIKEPSDIQTLLPILYNLTWKVKSVLELGVRTGLSTRAFLYGNLEKLTSIDIYENSQVRELFNLSKLINVDYEYIIADSLKYEPTQSYDLLFIDTEHTYLQLIQELNKYEKIINKYIVFHDVVTFGYDFDNSENKGLIPAILEFLKEHPEWKVKDFIIESNGLLVLEREGI